MQTQHTAADRKARSDRLFAAFMAQLRHLCALLDAPETPNPQEAKANFNPAQPRVPLGHPDGGQWTKVGNDATEDVDKAVVRARALVRKPYVLRGSGGHFVVEDNPHARNTAPISEHAIHSYMGLYDAYIEYAAKITGEDPDLIRAIIYIETTHGWYDSLPALFDANASIRPMNINTAYWGEAFGSREVLKNPLNNIIAGARLLKGIRGNLPPHAPVAHIATLYNVLGARAVNNYGKRVEDIYNKRLWSIHVDHPNIE